MTLWQVSELLLQTPKRSGLTFGCEHAKGRAVASAAGAVADTAAKADELALMSRFAAIAMFFTSTVAIISLAAFAVCIFSQREAAKWLSRSIWISWLVSWAIGVFGLAVYTASDTFVTGLCDNSECERRQRSLRPWLIAVSAEDETRKIAATGGVGR